MAGLVPTPTLSSIATSFAGGAKPAPGGNAPPTESATKPVAPASLTANFSTPVSPGTKSAPAVITSGAAEDHLANAKEQLKTLESDTANHAATSAPASAPKSESGKTPPTEDTQPKTPSIDDQISSLLSDLDTKSTAIETDAGQKTTDVDKELAQTQADDTAAATEATGKLQSISQGTYPLSATEQGLLSSTIASFQSALEAQKMANTAFTGRMTETLASLGIEQSAPGEALGLIYATISSSATKLADIGTKMATAVSNLQLKIQTQDYNQVSKAWTTLAATFKERTTTLTKLHTDIASAAKAAQTAAVNQTKTNLTALVDSDKLSQADKKAVVDAAYKQGTLDAKTYANITARIKANHAPGVIKPAPETVNATEQWLNTTRGKDGYVDPNAYKQAFDGWIADGNQAKDFVKNYPPKTFVNPTNNWLPSYLESKTGATASASPAQSNPF